jgi:gliding motility-associated-like protein
MKCLFICLGLSFSANLFAQLYINGVDFIINTSGIVYINSDSLLIENDAQFLQNGFLRVDKDLINESGLLVNDGDIYVNNNIIINDEVQGLSNLSNFYIRGNWTNNDVFSAGLSTVTLNGNLQEIRGTAVTGFYKLTTLGTLADKKTLVNIDATISNLFDLGAVEFGTEVNTLSILNPNTMSVQRSSGFVSSLDLGRLERATNTTDAYLFPTGSTIGTSRYRPIEITPITSTANVFGARLANLDATVDNFDVLNLSDSLCVVNPNFYHRLYAQTGAADLTMFYLPLEDGTWNDMANWEAANLWDETTNNINNSSSGGFSSVSAFNVTVFTPSPFALANKKPTLSLEDQFIINLGESVNISPVYSGSTPINVIWTPSDALFCSSCLETEANPTQTTLYTISLEAYLNCILNDSILIVVNPADLLFPDAFSPTADGVNETFRPIGANIEEYRINIYNRWGEKIYSSNDYVTGWDGTYKNEKAPIDVYTYSVQYKFLNIPEIKYYSSNLTLIR